MKNKEDRIAELYSEIREAGCDYINEPGDCCRCCSLVQLALSKLNQDGKIVSRNSEE